MILLAALVVSVAVALLRGGRLERLAELPLRWGWLALVAFALQVAVIYFPQPRRTDWMDGHLWLLLSSYALLGTVAIRNGRVAGVPLIGLGLLLNVVVMVANGGYMPVTPEALQRAGLTGLALGSDPTARVSATKDILLLREQTVLWVLSDIFVIPPPWPLRTIFSVGDVSLAVGAFVLFQQAMRSRRRDVPPLAGVEVGGSVCDH